VNILLFVFDLHHLVLADGAVPTADEATLLINSLVRD